MNIWQILALGVAVVIVVAVLFFAWVLYVGRKHGGSRGPV